MAGEHEALRAAEVGAGHHGVGDPLDLEPRGDAQRRLDVIRDGGFLVADRANVDQLGAAGEEVGHRRLTPRRRGHGGRR